MGSYAVVVVVEVEVEVAAVPGCFGIHTAVAAAVAAEAEACTRQTRLRLVLLEGVVVQRGLCRFAGAAGSPAGSRLAGVGMSAVVGGSAGSPSVEVGSPAESPSVEVRILAGIPGAAGRRAAGAAEIAAFGLPASLAAQSNQKSLSGSTSASPAWALFEAGWMPAWDWPPVEFPRGSISLRDLDISEPGIRFAVGQSPGR